MWPFRKKPKLPLDIAVHAPGPFRKGTPTTRRDWFKRTAGLLTAAVMAPRVTVQTSTSPGVVRPPQAVSVSPSGTVSHSFSGSSSISISPSHWEGENGERE